METRSTLKYLRVSVGTQCNSNCWYCFGEGIRREEPFISDVEGFAWLVNTLKRNIKLTSVRFTGGEPLLNPHLTDLISRVKICGIHNIGLTTNGILLPNMIHDLITAGTTNIAVHIEKLPFLINSEHNEINGIWSTLCNTNISSVQLRVNAVVTKSSLDDIFGIIDYCHQNELNLLLLDLIPNPDLFSADRFHREYIPLSIIEHYIKHKGTHTLKELSPNTRLFSYNQSEIKLVERFVSSDLSRVYCTKRLDWHPILLTPSFRLIWCNHFGAGNDIELIDSVERRDEGSLVSCFEECFRMLASCQKCILTNVL